MVTSAPAQSPSSTVGTVAGRVLEAQRLQRYLVTADGLREAASAISGLVRDSGCSNVMPASSSAAAAVAAAVLLDPGIATCDVGSVHSGRADKVLVVETVAVSGLRARRAVLELNEAGANWVGVSVLFPVLGDQEGDLAHLLGLDDLDAAVLV